ncbi:probable carboxylesterase 7 [Ananas comosus]|uniref:Probable carboxylesterase 7 n=1 Tax=Ananas comosus TaxID=4615 RepID=A0A6P5F984_ANACO|nr:probable carboxylesterase 7 [Ananas comosus]
MSINRHEPSPARLCSLVDTPTPFAPVDFPSPASNPAHPKLVLPIHEQQTNQSNADFSMATSSAASLAKRSFPFIALFSLAYLLLTKRRILPASPSSSFSSEPSSSPPTIDDPNSQVEFDFAPFLRLYKSGRVERRVVPAVVPASPSAAPGGAASFDVVLDPLTGLAARLYFPVLPNAAAGDGDPEPKLPILVYFHGGAFVVESAFSPTYHRYLDLLVARARIVAVSVEYRLAPEHPLPAAYDDAWAALRWAAANARPGKFLARYGDPGRIFLAGVSAGGNIAHNAALRVGNEGVRVAGLVLQNPYFWGKEPVAGETRDAGVRGRLESTWGFVCAGAYGIDHPYVNPMGGTGEGEWGRGMGCGRVMVTVAEDDVFRARGVAYAEGLRRSGFAGEVELYETRGEWHAYFLTKLDSTKAMKEIDAVIAFINRP